MVSNKPELGIHASIGGSRAVHDKKTLAITIVHDNVLDDHGQKLIVLSDPAKKKDETLKDLHVKFGERELGGYRPTATCTWGDKKLKITNRIMMMTKGIESKLDDEVYIEENMGLKPTRRTEE